MKGLRWPGFKIEDAYRFAEEHSLDAEAAAIRSMRIHPDIKKKHVPRKGAFIELFESKGLIDEFSRLYWPARQTPQGQARRQQYVDMKSQNDARLRGEILDEDLVDDSQEAHAQPTDAELAAFAMEGQLRDFIIKNMSRISIAGRQLRLFSDAEGRDGREYPTDVGPIDILAVDQSGNFYVFELKLDRGPDRALGQLARYMGWVKVHLAAGREVRGVVVARDIDQKLRYAACVIPSVELLEYEVDFRLRTADTIDGQPTLAQKQATTQTK